MQGIQYKDYNGNVFHFEDVLAYFDSLVHSAHQEVSLVYSPKSKSITVTLDETHQSFVFEEIEG